MQRGFYSPIITYKCYCANTSRIIPVPSFDWYWYVYACYQSGQFGTDICDSSICDKEHQNSTDSGVPHGLVYTGTSHKPRAIFVLSATTCNYSELIIHSTDNLFLFPTLFAVSFL